MIRKWAVVFFTLLLIGTAAAMFMHAPVEIDQPTGSVELDYSNIHPADYVGPESCAKCHQEQTSDWRLHPHGKMNLNPTDRTVQGDFSDHEIDYGNMKVVFDNHDGQFFMSMYEDKSLSRQYRVTRTVGSKFTQMYIGVQTEGPEPSDHSVYSVEGKLPFGYWKSRGSWYPESYFDTGRKKEPTDPIEMSRSIVNCQQDLPWNENCIYCHNTYPYQHRIFFMSEASGFPLRDIHFPNGTDKISGWGPVTPDQLTTLGISCESCHFGGREHALEGRQIRYVPTSPDLKVHRESTESLATDSPYVINSICAQCHCANVGLYPNGAATWNSREALDLISGACKNQIKCTDCHDPHRPTTEGGLNSLKDNVATCLSCHAEFKDPKQREIHTRHPASSGVSCLDCHMPRIVQGLESLVRTHHICSPTEISMLKNGGPNACNLCHPDRSIAWTLAELKNGWGRKIATDPSWESVYELDLDRPVGQVWLTHSIPTVRLVGADAISRAPEGNATILELLGALTDEYAVNRLFGLFAVERVVGRQLTKEEYSPLESLTVREAQVETLKKKLAPARSGSQVQQQDNFPAD